MSFNMDLDQFFDWSKRLAIGFQAVIGQNCEIVVHDFRDLDHTVIAIEGNLSGRQTGAPLPDMNFLNEGSQPYQEDQINYQIQIGRKIYQSSTIWIQDQDGKAVGALCINMDYSKLEEMQSFLETMLEPIKQDPQFVIKESLARDVQDLIQKTIQAMPNASLDQSPAALPAYRKKSIVQILQHNGVFNLRGSVEEVCTLLQISRATVYNYRKA
ncbi:MAG: PAS domain-containing protein [Anaerolineaceae bacterium]|nr:PAS domain-containing protein [Anaerolineaceae bacterium]